MSVNQLGTNLSDLSHSEFVLVVGDFANRLLVHSFFKNNWPDYITHPLKLKEQLAAYHEAAVVVDADGGRKNLKDRDSKREAICDSVTLMAQYVVMRANSENDPSLLENLGLKLKEKPVRSRKPKDSVVSTTISAKHGSDSGEVIVTYRKVDGAGTYELEICQSDPNVEEAWSTVGQYSYCRVPLRGLEPAKRVYFRVRCHGTGAPGPYSHYIGIIVL